jgi:hypothetical protein
MAYWSQGDLGVSIAGRALVRYSSKERGVATILPSQTGLSSGTETPTPTSHDAGLGFEWLMALLSAWLVGGLFLDGWAHAHGKVDQSFFTPWRAVFYSGFVAVALAPFATLVRRRSQARTWRAAIPSGYGATLAGAAVFAAGGVGDLIWHTFFGIERGVEALLSPIHLVPIWRHSNRQRTTAGGVASPGGSPLMVAWAASATRHALHPGDDEVHHTISLSGRLEQIDIVFYSDVDRAVPKVIEI